MDNNNNGAYQYRFDKLEKELEDMKGDLTSPLNRLSGSIDLLGKDLCSAIHSLSAKIDTLNSSHVKIIYWLLILVSSAFLGAKGAEIYNLLHK